MEELSVIKRVGTGNSQCSVPTDIVLRLSNIKISDQQMNDFISIVRDLGYAKNLRVVTSDRSKWNYGKANPSKQKVTLYREDVWTFLHEVAHCVVFELTGKQEGHNEKFGKMLDLLYTIWRVEMVNN